jgi:recombination protein RecA
MTNIDKILKDFSSFGISTATNATKYTTYPTPFSSLNSLIGGIPKARFTTFAGPEHTGKGAICAQIIADLQAKDPNFIALWTDAESSFDELWAKKLGVDLDRLIIQRYTKEINSMEKLLDQSMDLLKKMDINMWVLDSIGALLPSKDAYETKGKHQTEKSLEGTNMLNLQRKLGEFFRRANIFIAPRPQDNYEGCAVICIGQVYTDINAYVPMDVVKGGHALKHWAHLRLMFRRGPKSDWPEAIKIKTPDGQVREVFPGWSGRIKVEKTRINANEGKEILLPFKHGTGFDSKSATINSAFGLDLIERSGAIYSSPLLPGGVMKGKENVIKYFNDNPEAYQKLYDEVMIKASQDIPVDEDSEKNDND